MSSTDPVEIEKLIKQTSPSLSRNTLIAKYFKAKALSYKNPTYGSKDQFRQYSNGLVAAAIEAYPKIILNGTQLKHVKGVGRDSVELLDNMLNYIPYIKRQIRTDNNIATDNYNTPVKGEDTGLSPRGISLAKSTPPSTTKKGNKRGNSPSTKPIPILPSSSNSTQKPSPFTTGIVTPVKITPMPSPIVRTVTTNTIDSSGTKNSTTNSSSSPLPTLSPQALKKLSTVDNTVTVPLSSITTPNRSAVFSSTTLGWIYFALFVFLNLPNTVISALLMNHKVSIDTFIILVMVFLAYDDWSTYSNIRKAMFVGYMVCLGGTWGRNIFVPTVTGTE